MYSAATNHDNPSGRRWAILLAGGEGERLRGLTAERYGAHRPKQYCSFWGDRSMIDWTMHRASGLVDAGRTKVIIGNGHEALFAEAVPQPICGEVLVQPKNYGTLPGILLPLSHVLAEDPHATVIVMPTDHYIFPMHAFIRRARRAMELAERYPDKLVLLGAVPDSAVPDYGWVQCERSQEDGDEWTARTVTAFLEKPGARLAHDLYRRGWLWNTMMIVANVSVMWRTAYECAGDILHRFDMYLQVISAVRTGRAPAHHRQLALEQLYDNIEPADFSRDLLQRRPGRCAILPMPDVYWCDCGHPERLARITARAGDNPVGTDCAAGGRDAFHIPSAGTAAMS